MPVIVIAREPRDTRIVRQTSNTLDYAASALVNCIQVGHVSPFGVDNEPADQSSRHTNAYGTPVHT